VRLEFPADLGLLVPIAMSALSLRLFRLAWRTRRLPELLVGLYFLLTPFAISLSIRVERFAPDLAGAMRATANGLFTIGGITMLLFAWCVFRPDSRRAKGVAWGSSLALVALWAVGIPLGIYDRNDSLLLLLPVYASYTWVFGESLRYYRLARRRQRLGLADPVIVNRFLLFAIWTGGVCAITVLNLVGTGLDLLHGTSHDGGGLSNPVLLALTRVIAIPIAVSLWLVFLTPARYGAWLRARAKAAPPAL
jgi:hypothetical protein